MVAKFVLGLDSTCEYSSVWYVAVSLKAKGAFLGSTGSVTHTTEDVCKEVRFSPVKLAAPKDYLFFSLLVFESVAMPTLGFR